MSIRELQASLPWNAHDYNAAFRARTDAPRDAVHACLHVMKAVGKLAPFAIRNEWGGDLAEQRALVAKWLADVHICALRIAQTWPDGALDLGYAVACARRPCAVTREGSYRDLVEAAGYLADIVEDLEHRDPEPPDDGAREYAAAKLAEVWVHAERLAEHGVLGLDDAIDMAAAVRARIAEKFGGAP